MAGRSTRDMARAVHDTAWHGMAWRGRFMAQHEMALHGAAQHGTAWHIMAVQRHRLQAWLRFGTLHNTTLTKLVMRVGAGRQVSVAARLDVIVLAEDGRVLRACNGMAWHGVCMAWQWWRWHSMAWHGMVAMGWHGVAWPWHGVAWPWLGVALA